MGDAKTGVGDVVAAAREVLEQNRRGEWTCPSSVLYPHQWLWDSCFIAIGLAREDPERAAGELRALFRGQWDNGMLPHMIFAEGVTDIGSRRIWQSHRYPGAPRDVATSCITQPPLVAIAALRVAEALPPDRAHALLDDLFPKIVAYHRWLYDERDPEATGLITLIHPWESGLDTSPPWMERLAAMPMPWWLRFASRLHLARILRRLRYDTRHLPAIDRPSDDDGLRMLSLVTLAKRHQFELRRMPRDRAPLIEDLPFNSMLVTANRALERIATILGESLPDALTLRMRRTDDALESLWDDATGRYCSRDATTGELIRISTVGQFLSLWGATVPPSRVKLLVDQLASPAYWPAFPVPTVAVDAPQFSPTGYWKGPVWVNTNWMIAEGLRRNGEPEFADTLARATIDLVARGGCFEYFSPLDGVGHGAPDFSWTAALTLDLAGGLRHG